MKLIKKLLPVASLASVAAVAAPLATTSCSNTGKVVSYSFSYDAENPEEIAEYKPKFEALPQQTGLGTMTQGLAERYYFDQMDEDCSLYADDLLYAMYIEIYDEVWANFYDKIDGSIEVCVNSFTANEYERQSTYPYIVRGGEIDGYIKSNYTFTATDEIDGVEYTYSGYVNRKITFTNIPLIIYGLPALDGAVIWYSAVPVSDEIGFSLAEMQKYYKNASISFVDEAKRGDAVLMNDIVWTLDNYEEDITRFNIWVDEIDDPQYISFDLEDLLYEFSMYGVHCHYLENNIGSDY